MILYVVRHGIAAPHGTPGVAEDERPLTDEGIRKMNEVARGLKVLAVKPELILTSPLPRALQTARIVQETVDRNIALRTVECLSPAGSRADLYAELHRERKAASVMLVGHQPSLGEIAGEIAWGSADNYIELKKGGACCLEVEELRTVPVGTLVWLATPSLLRKLVSG